MDFAKMIPQKKRKNVIPADGNRSGQPEKQTVIMPDEICVCCGSREYIPEGYMICYRCRKWCEENM